MKSQTANTQKKNNSRAKALLILIGITAIFIIFNNSASFALSFTLSKNGNNIVGTPKTALVHEDEDFSAIAARYDTGYYPVLEANPGVDPDNPPANTVLIIPSQYVLPGELHNNIVINLAELRLYYQPKNSRKVYIYPVGIGKEGWVTPVGTFKIASKIANPKWVVPDSIYKLRKAIGDPIQKIVAAGPDNPLGHYAMRLSNPAYLIHGTNDPDGVGRRSSAGCIRMYPSDIEKLFHLVPIGTQVIIINKPYKAGWLNGNLYLEAHLPLLEQRMSLGNDVSPVLNIIEKADPNHLANINCLEVDKVAHEHVAIPQIIGKK